MSKAIQMNITAARITAMQGTRRDTEPIDTLVLAQVRQEAFRQREEKQRKDDWWRYAERRLRR